MKDPYFKLKPESPTPNEEICDCDNKLKIYIAHKLGSNPIYCLQCNGEIRPEDLKLDEKLIEAIASWNSVYGSLYRLWLDSGEYEEWARNCLLDSNGQVNIDGLNLLKQFKNISKAYYLWFNDNYENAPKLCPLCGQEFLSCEDIKFMMCNFCSIII